MKPEQSANMLPFFLILLVAIGLGASGQILLKAGLKQLPENLPALGVISSIFTNSRVFLGFVCYGVSSLVYLIALKRLPLSYAYPMVALSYVLVVTLSWKIFGEEIPGLRIAALVVILTGGVMLALSYETNGEDDGDTGAPASEVTVVDPDSGGT